MRSTGFGFLLIGMGWTAVTAALDATTPLLVVGVLLMLVGVVILVRGKKPSAADTPTEPASPLDRLRDALTRGISLRVRVMMEGGDAYESPEGEVIGGDPPPVSGDDPLYQWAKEAWEIVHRDFPEYADEFYGERGTHGFLMLAFSKEVNRDGRMDYLERRLDLLRRIIARRSDPVPPVPLTTGNGEPRNRAELRGWLDAPIEELVAWRAALDEEIAKPTPSVNRARSVQTMFWEGLNRDVSRKLQLLAPEWVDYWDEEPEWFDSILTRITQDQVAVFSRFLGWSAERLRHIKSELP